MQDPAHTSRYAQFCVILVVIWASLAKPSLWYQVISWDVFGYYLYLPALFIHGDIALDDPTWSVDLFDRYRPSATFYQINVLETGGRALKYPIGLAVLWAPFFFIGHLIAGVMGLPQDGMSPPYHAALVTGSWIYLFIGLHWLRKVLLRYFSGQVTAITILLVGIGSNVLYMSIRDPLMPHLFLFTIYIGVIWYTVLWVNEKRVNDLYMVAVLIGLAFLIRRTELILILIPILWGQGSFNAKQIIKSWRPYRRQLIISTAIIAVIFLPQMIYCSIATGSLFCDGYTNVGEGLDLHRPHLFEILFSFRKGLFIYTPIMGIALFGCVPLLRRYRSMAIPIIVFLVVYFWVVSSWTIWWYADSFGNRGIVQAYAIMALPLAALIAWILEKRIRKILFGALTVFFVALNIFQIWQTDAQILHTSRMTQKAYFKIFGRTERPEGLDQILVVQRDVDGSFPPMDPRRYQHVTSRTLTFETADPEWWTDRYVQEPFYSTPGSFQMDPAVPWSPAIRVPYGDITAKDHLYVHYSANVFIPQDAARGELRVVVGMEHKGGSYGVLHHTVTDLRPSGSGWSTIDVWYLTPVVRHPNDYIRGFLWWGDEHTIWVDDVSLELFEPIE